MVQVKREIELTLIIFLALTFDLSSTISNYTILLPYQEMKESDTKCEFYHSYYQTDGREQKQNCIVDLLFLFAIFMMCNCSEEIAKISKAE